MSDPDPKLHPVNDTQAEAPQAPSRRATPAQERAISARSGDLCVSAGAGSGKTFVLTERFRGLVADGVAPERILTITFTDKAAREMAARIGAALAEDGVPDARRAIEAAWISTIHGFCARLLREHALEAGVDPAFSVLTDVPAARARRVALLRAQREFRAAHPGVYDGLVERVRWGKDQDGQAGIRRRVLELYEQVRAAGADLRALDPSAPGELDALEDGLARAALERLAEASRCLLGEIAATRRSPSLERRAGEVAEVVARIAAAPLDRFRLEVHRDLGGLAKLASWRGQLAPAFAAVRAAAEAAAAAYAEGPARALGRGLEDLLLRFDRAYRALKEEQSLLDFSDLEERARRLLEEAPAVRQAVNERFEAVLIDEFQDTSRLQQRIVDLVRRPGGLFVVGDVKQSIYAFRHADVRGLLETEAAIARQGGEVIALDVSFRTRPELLAYTSEVFQQVFEESRGQPGAVPHQPLRPGVEFPDVDRPCVELVVGRGESLYRARGEEARAVAARLACLIEGRSVRGTNPLRADTFEQPLRYRDCAILLPATTALPFYERALRERGVPYRVASGRGFFDAREVVDAVQLLRVTAAVDDDLALAAYLRSPAVGLSDDALLALARPDAAQGGRRRRSLWRSLQAACAAPSLLAPLDLARADGARELLADLRAQRGRRSTRELLREGLERSGLLDGSLLRGDDVRAYANLEKLLEVIDDLERDGVAGPGPVAEVLEDLRLSGAREAEANVSSEEEDAVSLLTIHASKGLEWPLVVVADLGRFRRPGGDPVQWSAATGVTVALRDPDGGDAIVPAGLLALTGERQQLEREESKRLLYVAITRARDHLILGGAQSFHARRAGDWLGWARTPLDPNAPALALERDDAAGGVARLVATRGGVAVRTLEAADDLDGTPIVGPRGPSIGARPVLDGPERHALARRRLPRIEAADPDAASAATALLDRVRRLALPADDHGASVYSVSEVLAWAECPRRALLQSVIGEPGGPSGTGGAVPGAVRGTLVHEALASAIARGGRLPSVTRLAGRVAALLAPRPLPAAARERAARRARQLAEAFLRSPLGQAACTTEGARTEEPFLVSLELTPGESILLRGAADLLVPGPRGWTLVDYKSHELTALEVPLHRESAELQVQLYALALAAQGLEVAEARVVFLAPELECRVDLGPAALAAARRTVAEFFVARRSLQMPPRPGPACGHCPDVTCADAPRRRVSRPSATASAI